MFPYRYLFGGPARPRLASRDAPSDALVLGAYPSAYHVKWVPPALRPIAAVAVADEPEPFWEGRDQEVLLADWIQSLPSNPTWGEISPAARLNGTSGQWLSRQVLLPLGLSRSETWITDCLDIYHESVGVARRLEAPELRDLLARLKIPNRHLPRHPSERSIVHNAQLERLEREIRRCRPRQVITLGNAALLVFASFLGGRSPIDHLRADEGYGIAYSVTPFGLPPIQWIPLCHPAAPAQYQRAHDRWSEKRRAA